MTINAAHEAIKERLDVRDDNWTIDTHTYMTPLIYLQNFSRGLTQQRFRLVVTTGLVGYHSKKAQSNVNVTHAADGES